MATMETEEAEVVDPMQMMSLAAKPRNSKPVMPNTSAPHFDPAQEQP